MLDLITNDARRCYAQLLAMCYVSSAPRWHFTLDCPMQDMGGNDQLELPTLAVLVAQDGAAASEAPADPLLMPAAGTPPHVAEQVEDAAETVAAMLRHVATDDAYGPVVWAKFSSWPHWPVRGPLPHVTPPAVSIHGHPDRGIHPLYIPFTTRGWASSLGGG